MHLLVETNFILEFVFQHAQQAACERLVVAAEQQVLTLHMPAFSFMEPLYKLDGFAKARGVLQRQVLTEIRQAERGVTDKQTLQNLEREFVTLLQERNLLQQRRLMEVSCRLSAAANLIPLTHQVWTTAVRLHDETSLTLPDALVSASLLQRAQEIGLSEPKLFVTLDRKGFQEEEVKSLFDAVECEISLSFTHAVQKLRLA